MAELQDCKVEIYIDVSQFAVVLLLNVLMLKSILRYQNVFMLVVLDETWMPSQPSQKGHSTDIRRLFTHSHPSPPKPSLLASSIDFIPASSLSIPNPLQLLLATIVESQRLSSQ